METRIISGLAALCLTLLSCAGPSEDGANADPQDAVRLTWSPVLATRSSFSGGEGEVKSYVIAAYNLEDGILADCAANSSSGSSTICVYSGRYEIMVIANLGLGVGNIPRKLADMKELVCEIPSYGSSGIFPKGLPMAGSTVKEVSGSGDISGEIVLSRLVSKYVFSFKDGGVDGKPSTTGDDLGYRIKSVKLLQTAKRCSPFSDSGYAASSSSDILSGGDKASSADISSLASGGSAVFYVPENMQGVYPISGEWNKAFDNPVLSKVRDRLTYLEVELSFPSGNKWGISGNVTYRICLGDNVVNDFNVRRNSSYEVVMTGTADGLGVDSWRVEDGSSKPVIDASVSGADYLARKGTLTVSGWSGMTAEMRNSVKVSVSDPSAVKITSSGNGKYSLVPLKTGSYTVKVEGILHGTAEIPLKVSAPVLSLNSYSYSVTASAGATVKASFKDSKGKAITDFDAAAYASLLKPSISFKTLSGVMVASVSSQGNSSTTWTVSEGDGYLATPPSTPGTDLGSMHDMTFTDLAEGRLSCLLPYTGLRLGTISYAGEIVVKSPSAAVGKAIADLKATAEAKFIAKADGMVYDGIGFSYSYKSGSGCNVSGFQQSCQDRKAGEMSLWFVNGDKEVCVGKFECHVHATVRCHHQYNVNVITASDRDGFDPSSVPVSGVAVDSGTTTDQSSTLGAFAHNPFWFIYFYIDGGDVYSHVTYYAGASGSGLLSPPRFSQTLQNIQNASASYHKWEGALINAEIVSAISNSVGGHSISCPYEVLPYKMDAARYRYQASAPRILNITNLIQPVLAIGTTTEYDSDTGRNIFVNYKTPLGGKTAVLGDPDGSGNACCKDTYLGEKAVRMQGADKTGTFDGKTASDGKGYWWLHASSETYQLYSRSTASNPSTGESYRFVEIK